MEEPELEADPLNVEPEPEEVEPLNPPLLEKEVEGDEGELTKPPPLLLPPLLPEV